MITIPDPPLAAATAVLLPPPPPPRSFPPAPAGLPPAPPPPVPSQTSIIESHELVQKAIKQTMSESKNWNLLVINKYHNDTNATFNNLPEWAMGNQLNLAVVNQLYYNPTGNGVFNKPKI